MIQWILAVCAMLPMYLTALGEWENAQGKALIFQNAIQGWCSTEKALKLMDLIHDTQPEVCVEIGVFGGSSIYPMASALKFQKHGVIYAIDSWVKEDCIDGYESTDPNYTWWVSLDYEKIYQDFLHMLEDFRLLKYCNVLRMNSMSAVQYFSDESIDILHIDGNHSEQSALQDVLLFFPKVKTGGYIWFDDVNWSSTRKAVLYLSDRCEVIFDRSIGTECFLFQKI